MVWLTWRQHRAEALGGLLALAATAAILLALGLPAHHAFDHDGIAACLVRVSPAPGTLGNSCGEAIKAFSGRYLNSGVGALVPWLNFLPAVIGVFVGAPLLAREFEHGTWRLAWTQATPRTRWLAVKLALLVVGVATLTAASTALFTWYRGAAPSTRSRGAWPPTRSTSRASPSPHMPCSPLPLAPSPES